MIIGMGIDIVDINRIQRALLNPDFRDRVFTEVEQKYCLLKNAQGRASFSGRFAAKEAFLKAIGTGLRKGRLVDIEVVNDDLGKPTLNLYNHYKDLMQELGVKKIHLSISHTKDMAIAEVILEG